MVKVLACKIRGALSYQLILSLLYVSISTGVTASHAASMGSSQVDVSSGCLTHKLELLVTKGARLPISLSLYYNSFFRYSTSVYDNGPLGQYWTHSYDIALIDGGNGSKVLRGGDVQRLYTPNGGSFTSQAGDESLLSPNGTGFTISYRDGLKQNFGSDGKITSIVDRFGNSLNFAYTGGNLVSITDSADHVVTFEYNFSNQIIYICPPGVTTSDSEAKKFKFEYDVIDVLLKVTNPLASDTANERGYWEYGYNAGYGSERILATIRDPNGYITTYTRYPDRRIKDSIDPNGVPDVYGVATVPGHTRTFVYNNEAGTIKTTTLTEKDGGVWTYVYDTHVGVLKQKIAPNPDGTAGGAMTAYAYDANGNPKAKTEPVDTGKRLTTFYFYDTNGNRTAETEPLDLSLSQYAGIDPETVDTATFGTGTSPVKWAFAYEYGNYDRPTKITDMRGMIEFVKSYAYTTESGLEVTRITDPENRTTTLRRNPDGNLHSVSDPRGYTTAYEYYPNTPENLAAGIVGLLRSVRPTNNTRTDYTVYDINGNVREIRQIDNSGALKLTIDLEYDALNRLRKVVKTTTDTPQIVTETKYDYDASGKLTVTDPELKQTQYQFNHNNQVVKIIDHDQYETRLRYGGSGCASCGDGTDKLTEVLDAKQITNSWPGTTYQYDKLGRLERETDPRGKVIRYTYYDNSLLKQKIDATAVPEKILITYEYNDEGQITKKTHASGFVDSYEYDANGRLYKADNPHISYTLEWYKNGRLKSIVDNTGKMISYEYDNSGNIYKMTAPDGHPYYSYHDSSNRPYWLYTPAGVFDLGYDSLGRLDKIFRGWSSTPYITYSYDGLDRITSGINPTSGLVTYGYDRSGNRVSRDEAGKSIIYGYDNLYRLNTVTTNGMVTESYDYDEVGNRRTGPGTGTSYVYSQGNQLDSMTGATYEYDDYGNLKKRIKGTTTYSYAYDDENRLQAVEKKSGTVLAATVNLVYDPFGRRIERRVLKGTSVTVNRYVYDRDNILYEYDGVDQLVRRITNHPGAIDFPIAYNTGTAAYYYFRDALGSVNFVMDQNANTVAEYSYDSFGVPIKTRLGSQPQPFSYTGREYDTDMGLYYYRARYYDPTAGRFIQKDPLGFEGGDVNLYGYVQNNPINYVDPYGLWLQIPQMLQRIAPYIPAATKFVTDWAKGQVATPGAPSKYDAAKFVRDKMVPPEEPKPYVIPELPPGWEVDPDTGLLIPPSKPVCVAPRK